MPLFTPTFDEQPSILGLKQSSRNTRRLSQYAESYCWTRRRERIPKSLFSNQTQITLRGATSTAMEISGSDAFCSERRVPSSVRQTSRALSPQRNPLPQLGPCSLSPPMQLLRVAVCHLRATGELPFVTDIVYFDSHALLTIAPDSLETVYDRPAPQARRWPDPVLKLPPTQVRVFVALGSVRNAFSASTFSVCGAAPSSCGAGSMADSPLHCIQSFPELPDAKKEDIVLRIAVPQHLRSITSLPWEPSFLESCIVHVMTGLPPLHVVEGSESDNEEAAIRGPWAQKVFEAYSSCDISEHCLLFPHGGKNPRRYAFHWSEFLADFKEALKQCAARIWFLRSRSNS